MFSVSHSVFHSAGKLAAAGRLDVLYDPTGFGEEVAAARRDGLVGELAYLNPPAMAYLYAPTSGLSRELSLLLWTIAAVMAAGAAFWLVGVREWWFAALLAICSLPGMLGLRLGQPAFLWVFLLAGVFWMLHNGRTTAAGVLAGLTVLKPQFAVALALWWLIAGGQYRGALRAMATSGGLISMAGFVAAPGSFIGFWRAVLEAGGATEFPAGFSLIDAVSGVSADLAPVVPAALALLLGPAIMVVVVRRCREDLPALFAATMFVAVIMPARLLAYDWALVGLGVAVLWQHRPQQRPVWALVGVGVAVWAWVAWVTSMMLAEWFSVRFQPAAIGLVMIFAWCFGRIVDPDAESSPRVARNIALDV